MRKTTIAAVAALIVLSGCGQMMENRRNYLAREQARVDQIEATVREAAANRTVQCASKDQCDKALRLAKAFVSTNADLRVQHSDDVSVATYASTHALAAGTNLALGATLLLGAGQGGTVTLTAQCSATKYPQDGGYQICMDKIATAYRQFKPFIESRL